MGNTENKIRHIYCIEGNWNKHPHSNQSIKPILDLLFTFSKIKYIYKKCITKRDFRHYKIFCVNGNTGFRNESRIFYFIHLQNEEAYERKESSSA